MTMTVPSAEMEILGGVTTHPLLYLSLNCGHGHLHRLELHLYPPPPSPHDAWEREGKARPAPPSLATAQADRPSKRRMGGGGGRGWIRQVENPRYRSTAGRGVLASSGGTGTGSTSGTSTGGTVPDEYPGKLTDLSHHKIFRYSFDCTDDIPCPTYMAIQIPFLSLSISLYLFSLFSKYHPTLPPHLS